MVQEFPLEVKLQIQAVQQVKGAGLSARKRIEDSGGPDRSLVHGFTAAKQMKGAGVCYTWRIGN